MDRETFQEAIHNGLGRAIVYARENDVQQFRDVILDACLHCHSVDTQTEGTRAGYMFDLVDILPDRQFYFDQVLNALPGSGDDSDAVQLFEFAFHLSDGDDRAKQVMYESFEPGPRKGTNIAIIFVRMAGLAGLLFAASKIGALLVSNARVVDTDWLWYRANEICGEHEVEAALSEAGATDAGVRAYLAAIENRTDTSNDVKGLSYEKIAPKLIDLRPFRLMLWGRKASEEDLASAAHGLLAAQDPGQQLQFLQIFKQRQFPLDPSRLMRLTSSTSDELADAAAAALSQITHPSVREIAFGLIDSRRAGREHAITMLSQNWEFNDHAIVLGWFESEPDRYTRHHLELGILDFWDHHPESTSEIPMLFSLYEKGPCCACRERVVRRLIVLDALTPSLRAECLYDTSEEIRELVAAPPPSVA